VHDVGLYEDRPYLVFEHVAGRSLAEQLRHERPTPRAAAALTAEVAALLHRVHGSHVWHRDLKPANILIDTAGRPRLLDFGLACLSQFDEPAQPGTFGTPAYMAPEQARGETGRIGPRTDVFGLGAVLYTLLTGQAPYRGSDMTDVWEQAKRGRVQPPRQLNPGVPRALGRICVKALATEPAQRYASVAELERSLRSYLRRPRRLALAGAVVLAGLLLAAALTLLKPKPAETPPPPVPLTGELIVRVWTPGEG